MKSEKFIAIHYEQFKSDISMLVIIQIPFKYKNQDVSVCSGPSDESNTKPYSQTWGSHLHSLEDASLTKPNPGLHLRFSQAKQEQEVLLN